MLLFIKVTILVTNICSVDHHVHLNIGTSKREFCIILLSLCAYQWTDGRLGSKNPESGEYQFRFL